MASDTGAPLTFPHCKQRSRLFEAIEPPTIKRPRKGKTSIRKFVFFGKFAKPRGSHSQENQDHHWIKHAGPRRLRCPAHHEPGKVTVLRCIAAALILVLTFSLTVCNGRCLTTPALGRRLIRIWARPSEIPLDGLFLLLFTSSRYRQGETNQSY